MRVSFDQVFQTNPNGSVSPKMTVVIGGVTMTPGVSFTTGVSFGGLDVASLKGKDLEVDQSNGVTTIKGHY
jgi:hypothetical protein